MHKWHCYKTPSLPMAERRDPDGPATLTFDQIVYMDPECTIAHPAPIVARADGTWPDIYIGPPPGRKIT